MNDGGMSTRRRDKMPRRLYFMALLFLFLPIGNYLVTNITQDESVFDIFGFLHQHNTMGVILICAPFFLGVALFFVRKWGYFLVLCYAAFLAIYNLVVAIQSPAGFNNFAFLTSLAALLFLFNFLRQDILAPFIVAYPRGFRRFGRFPMEIDVFMNRQQAKTVDLSASGMMIESSIDELETNSQVEVSFKVGGDFFSLEAGVTRVEGDYVALAFRNMKPGTRWRLRSAIFKESSKGGIVDKVLQKA